MGSVFTPAQAREMYEDNFQRLLLSLAFKLEETQKLAPRGAILAYMSLFAPVHDPIIEVSLHKPTTLRGLFSNILLFCASFICMSNPVQNVYICFVYPFIFTV